jgi:hypothetical protein
VKRRPMRLDTDSGITMRVTRKIVLPVALLGSFLAYWIGSEVTYAQRISPRGISTASDFVLRFGEPERVRLLSHGGQVFYEFTGPLPSSWMLAPVSAPPAYVFDERGRFVTWCRDPGELPAYRGQWPLQRDADVATGDLP